MSDTATKQRIKGDLDDRVDDLEKRVTTDAINEALDDQLNDLENRIDKLCARIDKLEAIK